MCILIASTRHSDFPLIILSNRDEFIQRPTAPAHFWAESAGDVSNILAPFDLARETHGTWIGITTSGRFAVTLNYREKAVDAEPQNVVEKAKMDGEVIENDMVASQTTDTDTMGPLSRGLFPNLYLRSDLEPREWCDHLLGKDSQSDFNVSRAGGFSLLCGHIQVSNQLPVAAENTDISSRVNVGTFQVVSNRGTIMPITHDSELGGRTFSLSNSHLAEVPEWPKVTLGKRLLDQAIDQSLAQKRTRAQFVDELFAILSHDTYTELFTEEVEATRENIFDYRMESLAESIFIPPFSIVNGLVSLGSATVRSNQESSSGPKVGPFGEYYGTRTQTIILVDKTGKVTYYERNLQSPEWPLVQTPPTNNVFEFQIKN